MWSRDLKGANGVEVEVETQTRRVGDLEAAVDEGQRRAQQARMKEFSVTSNSTIGVPTPGMRVGSGMRAARRMVAALRMAPFHEWGMHWTP
jgi:hypothetical protein